MRDEKEMIKIKEELENLTYEEKLEYVAFILCDEWYKNDHYDFIKKLLDIFYKS
jgi:hypothetical protein